MPQFQTTIQGELNKKLDATSIQQTKNDLEAAGQLTADPHLFDTHLLNAAATVLGIERGDPEYNYLHGLPPAIKAAIWGAIVYHLARCLPPSGSASPPAPIVFQWNPDVAWKVIISQFQGATGSVTIELRGPYKES